MYIYIIYVYMDFYNVTYEQPRSHRQPVQHNMGGYLSNLDLINNKILFGTLKIHVKTETQSLGLLSKGQQICDTFDKCYPKQWISCHDFSTCRCQRSRFQLSRSSCKVENIFTLNGLNALTSKLPLVKISGKHCNIVLKSPPSTLHFYAVLLDKTQKSIIMIFQVSSLEMQTTESLSPR